MVAAARGGDAVERVIRPVRLADAVPLRELQKRLDQETPFMLLEPGEEPEEIEAWERRIASFLEERHSKMWVLEGAGDKLSGFLFVRGNKATRLRHSGLVVVGIRKTLWGQGLGTALFREMEAWALHHGFARLELTVVVANERAIALYHKMGFVVEGLRRRSMRYADGTYVDEYMMAKLL